MEGRLATLRFYPEWFIICSILNLSGKNFCLWVILRNVDRETFSDYSVFFILYRFFLEYIFKAKFSLPKIHNRKDLSRTLCVFSMYWMPQLYIILHRDIGTEEEFIHQWRATTSFYPILNYIFIFHNPNFLKSMSYHPSGHSNIIGRSDFYLAAMIVNFQSSEHMI